MSRQLQGNMLFSSISFIYVSLNTVASSGLRLNQFLFSYFDLLCSYVCMLFCGLLRVLFCVIRIYIYNVKTSWYSCNKCSPTQETFRKHQMKLLNSGNVSSICTLCDKKRPRSRQSQKQQAAAASMVNNQPRSGVVHHDQAPGPNLTSILIYYIYIYVYIYRYTYRYIYNYIKVFYTLNICLPNCSLSSSSAACFDRETFY